MKAAHATSWFSPGYQTGDPGGVSENRMLKKLLFIMENPSYPSHASLIEHWSHTTKASQCRTKQHRTFFLPVATRHSLPQRFCVIYNATCVNMRLDMRLMNVNLISISAAAISLHSFLFLVAFTNHSALLISWYTTPNLINTNFTVLLFCLSNVLDVALLLMSIFSPQISSILSRCTEHTNDKSLDK